MHYYFTLKKYFYSLVITVFYLVPLLATEEKKNFLKGFLEIDHISYFAKKKQKHIRNQIHFQPSLISRFKKNISSEVSFDIKYDAIADLDLLEFTLRIAQINFYLKNITFNIGKQIISWGVSDWLNPTDNFNSWDFRDFLDIEDNRQGNWALRVKWLATPSWELEGVLLPAYASSRGPGLDSAWNISPKTTMFDPGSGPALFTIQYEEGAKAKLSGWSGRQFGLKSSFQIKSVDLSLSYYDGFDDFSSSIASITSVDTANQIIKISIDETPETLRVIGSDISTSIKKIGLRAEVAYKFRNQFILKKNTKFPHLQYVLEIDHRINRRLWGNDLYWSLSWSQSLFGKKPDVDNEFNLTEPFLLTVAFQIKYIFRYYGELALNGLYDFRHKAYLLTPQVEFKISDNLKLNILFNLIKGESKIFINSFNKNNRVQVKLKYFL